MKQSNRTGNAEIIRRNGQIRQALVFLCVTAALVLAVWFVLSPICSSLVFSAAVRIRMTETDVSDNGVSDYGGLSGAMEGKDDFALSLLPDVPAGYTLAKDYLMFLNREKGVTRIVLNISAGAAELLNAGLTGVLDEAYYNLTLGSFCASVEFRDFVSLVRSLNLHLLPGDRISFIGIADSPAEEYGKAADEYGTLLIMSRDEAHGEGKIGSMLPVAADVADIYYVSADTSSDEKVTDFFLPLAGKGYYLLNRADIAGICDYYRFTARFTGRDGSGYGHIISADTDFFFIVSGGIADAAKDEEQTDAEGDVIDYGV